MGSSFFGLTSEYKLQLYQEIHDLVYYGNGGFIYSEVYNMPIHIRRFHTQKISELHDEQNKEHEKIMNKYNNHKAPTKSPNIPKNLSF